LTLDDSFELVYDSTIQAFFAQTTGADVMPLMLAYDNGLFFLIVDYDPFGYFPLQGGVELRMAVSTDGQEWAVSNQSIFSFAEDEAFTFRPYSLIRLSDGSYALYGAARAEAIETIQRWSTQFAIVRATASNLMEDWVVYPEPLLLPGGAYEWDRSAVWSPYVFSDSNGFRMYYWGQPGMDFNSDNGVGVAISEDGVTWQKSLPGENDPSGAESNRLLSRSQPAWEEIILLHIWRTVDGWQLMYYLRDRRDGGFPHLASSPDGIEWTPLDGDLQLPESTTPDDIIYASLIYGQGRYWLLYCVDVDNAFCYLARTVN
jgi:hypothetical protein